jgi:Arc/MetJ-type ribon-helix-helix transcriptional regulator
LRRGRKDKTCWLIAVTRHLDDLLESTVARNAHITKSDFVREAVREKLERMGVKITVPDEVREEAKNA